MYVISMCCVGLFLDSVPDIAPDLAPRDAVQVLFSLLCLDVCGPAEYGPLRTRLETCSPEEFDDLSKSLFPYSLSPLSLSLSFSSVSLSFSLSLLLSLSLSFSFFFFFFFKPWFGVATLPLFFFLP